MGETIEYWSARKPDRFRFWYFFEKTPLFWARYYQLIKVPHQLIHPELEVAIRVAWLKRLRLALHYFIGRSSQFAFIQLPLNSIQDIHTLTHTLLLDIDNLNVALSDAFAIPGLKFDLNEFGALKASEISPSPSINDPLFNDTFISNLDHQQENPTLPSDSSDLISRDSSFTNLDHSHLHHNESSQSLDDHHLHPQSSSSNSALSSSGSHIPRTPSSLSTKPLTRTTTSSNLLRSVRKDPSHGPTHHFQRDTHHTEGLKTPALSPRSSKPDPAPSSSTPSSSTLKHEQDHPQSNQTQQYMKKSSSHRHLTTVETDQSDSTTPLASSASTTTELESIGQLQQLHSYNQPQIQAMQVENLDANLMISPPQVDELVASYRARERVTQANLSLISHLRKPQTSALRMMPVTASATLQPPQISRLEDSYSPETQPLLVPGEKKHVHFEQGAEEAKEKDKPNLDSLGSESQGIASTMEPSSSILGQQSLESYDEDHLRTSLKLEQFLVSCGVVEQCIEVVSMKIRHNGIPPFYSRNWMVCSAVGVVVGGLAFRLMRNWTPFTMQVKEAKNAMVRFLVEHAVSPIIGIYKTIRYDSSDVEVMSKNSLDDDVASLVRMVEDFNRDKNARLTPKELDSIALETRSGTIPSVMNAYEREISHPIANALAGDLLRLALIQVQKQKVDIEKAMAQLDRLLKQNEINFQLMALLPVALVGTGLFSLWANSTRDPYKKQHTAIRSLLRRVAIHVNRSSLETFANSPALPSSSTAVPSSALRSTSSPPSSSSMLDTLSNLSNLRNSLPPLLHQHGQNDGDHHHIDHHNLQTSSFDHDPFDLDSTSMHNEDFGLLLCLLSQLFSLAVTLPVQERIGFIEDLSDLAKVNFSARQRLATIQRMYNNYRFLGETP